MNSFFEEFQEASKELCKEFGITSNKIEFKQYETPEVGVDYDAKIKKDNLELTFHLRTNSDNDDPTKGFTIVTLYIKNSELSDPYPVQPLKSHDEIPIWDLLYWLRREIYDYNLKNNRPNLDELFRGKYVKIYGFPKYSEPSNTEFNIFMTGLNDLSTKRKLMVTGYRFRHRNEYSNFSYSYAIFVPDNLWIIFPDAAGGGGGGGEDDFEFFESMMNKRRKFGTTIRYFDIDYQYFEHFLLKKELTFAHSITDENILFPIVSKMLTEKCKDLFMDRYFSKAVFEATKILELEIKSKSGLQNKYGVELIEKAFDDKNPLVKINDGTSIDDEKEMKGFKLIYKGMLQVVRNLNAHGETEISRLQASQYISFIDLLIKKLR